MINEKSEKIYVEEFEIEKVREDEYKIIFEGEVEGAENIYTAIEEQFQVDTCFSIWVDEDIIEIIFDFYDIYDEKIVEIKDSEYFVDECFEKTLIKNVNELFWWIDEIGRYKEFRIFNYENDEEIEFEGELDLATVNDDEPVFHFIGEGGDSAKWFTDLIGYPNSKEEAFIEAIHDDDLFIQRIYDCNEGDTVNLKGYSLHIFENEDSLSEYMDLDDMFY